MKDKIQRRLITIGSGSGYTVLGKGGPAHLVLIDDIAFLMDCGEGAAGWLHHLGLTLRIKFILLTHLHADHTSGLLVLLQNMLLDGRKEHLDVYMPETGIEPFAIMQETVYLTSEITEGMFQVNYKPLTESIIQEGADFRIRAWHSDHFAGDAGRNLPERYSYGFTVDADGARLVYTGDVTTTECFKQELKSNSALLCEAMHLEAGSILEVAREMQLKKVIFTHINPAKSLYLEEFCRGSDLALIARDGLEVSW